ncbi:hypothetical protein ABC383_23275 [Noviherbaspirillum sp. 1P10PC]|uniref:hypothetical protein n=1 Tax=Noviherbaspirillum sp. 1P10PC TaxID=3132292 RepID=UPI0039A26DF0
MEHYRYKNNSVEIFPAKIGDKWTAAFMVNGKARNPIKDAGFDTKELASEAAKAEAETLIDQHGGVIRCHSEFEAQKAPPSIFL